MTILILYIIIATAFIVSGVQFKRQYILYQISALCSDISFDKHKLEFVMQPRWISFAIIIIGILQVLSVVLFWPLFKWWSILMVIGLYLVSTYGFRISPFPTIKSIIHLYQRTVSKRLLSPDPINNDEKIYLDKAKELLDKAVSMESE